MDNKCPECGFDLSKSVLVYAKPQMKGAFAEFIEKLPIICPKCKAELEVNTHRLERTRIYCHCVFYFLISALINIKHIPVTYAVILFLVYIIIVESVFRKKLKFFERYKIYENQQKHEKTLGYIFGSLIYFILFSVIVFSAVIVSWFFITQ